MHNIVSKIKASPKSTTLPEKMTKIRGTLISKLTNILITDISLIKKAPIPILIPKSSLLLLQML